MKRIVPFLLLALTACGIEPASDTPEHSPPDDTQSYTVPDTVYDESTGESQDVSADDAMRHKVDTNDIVIRMIACNYIPLLIDTNPITGEGIYLIKWHCPPGFH